MNNNIEMKEGDAFYFHRVPEREEYLYAGVTRLTTDQFYEEVGALGKIHRIGGIHQFSYGCTYVHKSAGLYWLPVSCITLLKNQPITPWL